jgi:hypothetical protein
MAKKTFFSFHYKQDVWRAGVVRNSWVTKERDAAGFFDSAEWEEVKKKKDDEIEKWIDGQLKGTSVTVVLIGEKTYGRKWINYEITASWKKGKNPFDQWDFKNSNSEIVKIPVYNWIDDDGYANLGSWINKVKEL